MPINRLRSRLRFPQRHPSPRVTTPRQALPTVSTILMDLKFIIHEIKQGGYVLFRVKIFIKNFVPYSFFIEDLKFHKFHNYLLIHLFTYFINNE